MKKAALGGLGCVGLVVAGGDPGLRHIWLSAHQMNWDMDVRQTLRMVLAYRLFTALVLQPDFLTIPSQPELLPITTGHSPSHLQTGEDLSVSAQGAQAPATLCASQTADVMAPALGREGGLL